MHRVVTRMTTKERFLPPSEGGGEKYYFAHKRSRERGYFSLSLSLSLSLPHPPSGMAKVLPQVPFWGWWGPPRPSCLGSTLHLRPAQFFNHDLAPRPRYLAVGCCCCCCCYHTSKAFHHVPCLQWGSFFCLQRETLVAFYWWKEDSRALGGFKDRR